MNTEGTPGTRGRSWAAQDPDLLSRLGTASRAGTSVQQEAPPREAVVKGAGADSAATLAERLGPPGASRLPPGSPQGNPPPHPNQTPSRHCPDQIRLNSPRSCDCRCSWGWVNAVFNKVVGAHGWRGGLSSGRDRTVHGFEPCVGLYSGIDTTSSCITSMGFDHMRAYSMLEKMRLCEHHYVKANFLERLSKLENLQKKSMLEMETISCGNITGKGIIALHRLRNLKYLLLSDLPGIREKENLIQAFKTTLPSSGTKIRLEIK
uniref:Uncharacterized protein n=1 Tax=Lynx canadensis TaxID=61383 RepID=A0A667H5R8_LYNCA